MESFVGTLSHRWWALIFIPIYFWAAREERSWARALRFYVIACAASFAAEYASTHTGFPYGRYTYETATRGQELFLRNVPLFVPLTFGVVVWAGRSIARGLARTRAQLVIGGALAAAVLDLAIDPMTLRGEQWFMGHLYTYAHQRGFFDVPWSNFFGWLLVSAFILAFDAAFENFEPNAAMRGSLLAIGTGFFFAVIGIAAHHEKIPAASAGITMVLGGIAFFKPLMRALRRRRGSLRSPS